MNISAMLKVKGVESKKAETHILCPYYYELVIFQGFAFQLAVWNSKDIASSEMYCAAESLKLFK